MAGLTSPYGTLVYRPRKFSRQVASCYCQLQKFEDPTQLQLQTYFYVVSIFLIITMITVYFINYRVKRFRTKRVAPMPVGGFGNI